MTLSSFWRVLERDFPDRYVEGSLRFASSFIFFVLCYFSLLKNHAIQKDPREAKVNYSEISEIVISAPHVHSVHRISPLFPPPSPQIVPRIGSHLLNT